MPGDGERGRLLWKDSACGEQRQLDEVIEDEIAASPTGNWRSSWTSGVRIST